MRKVTQKKIEKFLLNFYPEMEISQEEKNELYQLYLQLESMGQNMIICLAGIERQIFVFEEIYQDNVNYFRSFNINYSSSIFSNKLIRQYSFELLTHIEKCNACNGEGKKFVVQVSVLTIDTKARPAEFVERFGETQWAACSSWGTLISTLRKCQ